MIVLNKCRQSAAERRKSHRCSQGIFYLSPQALSDFFKAENYPDYFAIAIKRIVELDDIVTLELGIISKLLDVTISTLNISPRYQKMSRELYIYCNTRNSLEAYLVQDQDTCLSPEKLNICLRSFESRVPLQRIFMKNKNKNSFAEHSDSPSVDEYRQVDEAESSGSSAQILRLFDESFIEVQYSRHYYRECKELAFKTAQRIEIKRAITATRERRTRMKRNVVLLLPYDLQSFLLFANYTQSRFSLIQHVVDVNHIAVLEMDCVSDMVNIGFRYAFLSLYTSVMVSRQLVIFRSSVGSYAAYLVWEEETNIKSTADVEKEWDKIAFAVAVQAINRRTIHAGGNDERMTGELKTDTEGAGATKVGELEAAEFVAAEREAAELVAAEREAAEREAAELEAKLEAVELKAIEHGEDTTDYKGESAMVSCFRLPDFVQWTKDLRGNLGNIFWYDLRSVVKCCKDPNCELQSAHQIHAYDMIAAANVCRVSEGEVLGRYRLMYTDTMN